MIAFISSSMNALLSVSSLSAAFALAAAISRAATHTPTKCAAGCGLEALCALRRVGSVRGRAEAVVRLFAADVARARFHHIASHTCVVPVRGVIEPTGPDSSAARALPRKWRRTSMLKRSRPACAPCTPSFRSLRRC